MFLHFVHKFYVFIMIHIFFFFKKGFKKPFSSFGIFLRIEMLFKQFFIYLNVINLYHHWVIDVCIANVEQSGSS